MLRTYSIMITSLLILMSIFKLCSYVLVVQMCLLFCLVYIALLSRMIVTFLLLHTLQCFYYDLKLGTYALLIASLLMLVPSI